MGVIRQGMGVDPQRREIEVRSTEIKNTTNRARAHVRTCVPTHNARTHDACTNAPHSACAHERAMRPDAYTGDVPGGAL